VVRERLFEPLGMRDTASVPDDLLIEPGIATFHQATPTGSWLRGLTLIDDNRGAGAVVTTVDDMLRWLANLRGPSHTLGSPALWQQMTTPARLPDGTPTGYALGLYVHGYRGVQVVHHGGSLAGVASQIVSVPEHGLDIVILSNGALVNPVQMGWQVVDTLLGPQLQGEAPPLVPMDGFAHLAGRHYRAESGLLLGFDEVGGQLGLRLMGSPAMPVLRDLGPRIGLRVEETGFGPLWMDRACLAEEPGGAPPAEIEATEAGRVERLRLLPGAPEGDATADDGLPGGGREFVLHPLGNDVWALSATDPEMPGFYALSAERRRGRVTTLRLDSVRVRRLRFDRVAG
jgi:hypothetical protein